MSVHEKKVQRLSILSEGGRLISTASLKCEHSSQLHVRECDSRIPWKIGKLS